MAEIPRLRQASNKIVSVSDHMTNGVNSKQDSLIVDLGSFSNGGLYHHISPDSRIIVNADSQQLQRSFSRKGYLRSAADSASLLLAPSTPSSPGGQSGPNLMQEKPTLNCQPPVVVIAVGPTDDSDNQNHHHGHQNSSNNNNHHHQITVKTSNVLPATSCTSPDSLGRRRSSLPWYNHPKRVLLFFATISTIGTMLLICFTLAINKPSISSD